MQPDWYKKLRPYQQVGAEFLAWPPFGLRGRILADGRGFGKTRQALAAARLRWERNAPSDAGAPITVVTIAAARLDWKNEVARFWPELEVHSLGDDDAKYQCKGESNEEFRKRRDAALHKAFDAAASPRLLVLSYESAERLLDFAEEHQLLLGVLILDEAHAVKKEATLRSQILRPLVGRASLVSLLTGTPIHNRAEDLHQLLDLCALGRFGSKWSFARRYFRIITEKHGHRIGDLLDKEGLRRDIAKYALARDAKEAYGQLPACIRELRFVEGVKGLPRITREAARKLNNVHELNAALRAAAAKKLTAAAQFIAALDEPVVAYTFERQHAQELANLLKKARVPVMLATGATDPKRRTKNIELWKAGESRVLVCTMDAVKESATLTRASAMIFADLDWLPGKQLQCEGRIHPSRQPEGERRPARYYYFVVRGGPDEVVAERVLEKIHASQGIVSTDDDAVTLGEMLKPFVEKEAKFEGTVDVLADLMERLIARAERLESI